MNKFEVIQIRLSDANMAVRLKGETSDTPQWFQVAGVSDEMQATALKAVTEKWQINAQLGMDDANTLLVVKRLEFESPLLAAR